MKKKVIALALGCTVAFGCAVGGTLAWLTDSTKEVKNTFTTSDITIELTETTTDYQMVPGHTIAKDPMVTLDKDSEACYLFIKVEEDLGSWSDNGKVFTDYLSYSINTDIWTAVEEKDGIYYKKVDTADLDAATADLTYKIIKGDTITVSGENVDKALMKELYDGGKKPTLTFKAAAVQLYEKHDDEFTVKEALDKVEWPTDTATTTP